eukprot:1138867-Pelagomonas_calceolata.AAC.1
MKAEMCKYQMRGVDQQVLKLPPLCFWAVTCNQKIGDQKLWKGCSEEGSGYFSVVLRQDVANALAALARIPGFQGVLVSAG